MSTLATLKRSLPKVSPDERTLAGLKAHTLFPQRTTLYVAEVARVLSVTEQQVIDLIHEYRDTDGTSGLAAVNIASGRQTTINPRGNRSPRAHWRIPVSAFDAFIDSRKNRDREG
jgi:hypothetical protein